MKLVTLRLTKQECCTVLTLIIKHTQSAKTRCVITLHHEAALNSFTAQLTSTDFTVDFDCDFVKKECLNEEIRGEERKESWKRQQQTAVLSAEPIVTDSEAGVKCPATESFSQFTDQTYTCVLVQHLDPSASDKKKIHV